MQSNISKVLTEISVLLMPRAADVLSVVKPLALIVTASQQTLITSRLKLYSRFLDFRKQNQSKIAV